MPAPASPSEGIQPDALPSDLAPWSLPEAAFEALLSLASDGRGDPGWRDIYRMAVESGDVGTAQVALANLGGGLATAGRYIEAEACGRRAMAWALASGDELGMGHACVAVAAARWSAGDAAGAVAATHHALRVAERATRSAPSSPGLSGPWMVRLAARQQLLAIRMARGELRRAMSDQTELLELHRRVGDPQAVAGALEGMGNIAKAMGRYAESFEWYAESLREIEPLEPRLRAFLRAGLLGNAAVVLTWLGDTDGALDSAREGRRLCSELGDPIGVIACLGQEARAHLRAGAPGQAVPLLEDMLERADAARVAGWRKAAHANLASALLAEGKRSAAAAHCEAAFALARHALGQPSLEDWWLRVEVVNPGAGLTAAGEPSGDAALCVALAGFAVEALQAEQRLSRPSALAERWIGEMEAVIVLAFALEATVLEPTPAPPNLPEPLGRLAAVAATSPFQGWRPQDIGFYCTECLRAQEFQEQLRLGDADLGRPGAPSPLDFGEEADTQGAAPYRTPSRLADLRAALFEDELFLEFILTGQAGSDQHLGGRKWTPWPAKPVAPAFVVAAMNDWSAVLPLGPTAALEVAVRTFSAKVSAPEDPNTPAALESVGADLYDALVAPAMRAAGSRAQRVRRITLAPDGALNGLPFDLLAVERRNSLKWREVAWLGRSHAISVTPSGTVLTDIRAGAYATRPKGTAFVGLGDPTYVRPRNEEGLAAASVGAPRGIPAAGCDAQPLPRLPGSRQELASIAEMFRSSGTSEDDVVVLLENAAAKAHLTPELLERAAYLHLACHGAGGLGAFLDGALFLADAVEGDDEGVLTAREIAGLRTGARLVVMSACESACGVLGRGEGLQGMVRAWLLAGAESVIASLWEVDDDSTALLMENFYRNCLTGVSIREALAAAKRALMDDPQWGHPYFWAAFVQFADAEERRAPTRRAATLSETPAVSRPPVATAREHGEDNLGRLVACAAAWESWRSGKAAALSVFLTHARNLAGVDIRHPDINVLLGCVARACGTARQEQAAAGRIVPAVEAYKTQVIVRAGARHAEWDALAAAHSHDNLVRIRALASEGRLRRDFVVRLASDFGATLETTTTWLNEPASMGSLFESVLISFPMEAEAFSSSEAATTACTEAGRVVFPLRPSQSVTVTERLESTFRLLPRAPSNMRLHSAIWGSVRYPASLTLLLARDLVPIRTQIGAVEGPVPSAWLTSTSLGVRITLSDDADRPWLARFAVLVRHVPGAADFLAREDQPFSAGMTVAAYETLLASDGRS